MVRAFIIFMNSFCLEGLGRFFQWDKLQPRFTHNTLMYNKLTNLLAHSKDFETLQNILAEMLPARCNYSVKTFSFVAAWHDDSDMLNKVIEMIDKMEISPRKHAYEMLIATLCEENHANASLDILEKMMCWLWCESDHFSSPYNYFLSK